MCKIYFHGSLPIVKIKYSIPSPYLQLGLFPRDFDELKGLPSSVQYIYFALWSYWNEFQAEIDKAMWYRWKDIARKCKPKKERADILKRIGDVPAQLRSGEKAEARVYLSPRTLEIIPKAFSNEIPYWFPINDEDFCSLFHVSRRSLTGKAGRKGARELLKEKNLIDYRVVFSMGKKTLGYKLLDPLENVIELHGEVIYEFFYKREDLSFSTKALFFWLTKYMMEKSIGSNNIVIKNFNIQEFRDYCSFNIKTIKKGIDEIINYYLLNYRLEDH